MRQLIRSGPSSSGTNHPAEPVRKRQEITDNPLNAFAHENHSPRDPLISSNVSTLRGEAVAHTRLKHASRTRRALETRTARVVMLSCLACASAAAIFFPLWNRFEHARPRTVRTQTGTATISSRPEGLTVVIDDEVRGTTPLKVALPLGNHTLQIQAGEQARSIPLVIEAGMAVFQDVDFGFTQIQPSAGRVEVASDQSGSSTRVDRKALGSPLLAQPGKASATASARSAPVTTAGWVSFTVPFEMQVLEDGRVIGTTSTDRIMLPTGAHQLDLVSAALEFRTTTSVEVVTGRTVNIVPAVPNGSLSVNALPWADVEIDGRAVGTTPLADIPVPIGSHELVWKHPQRGERRRTIMVTAGSPLRIGVDFSQ